MRLKMNQIFSISRKLGLDDMSDEQQSRIAQKDAILDAALLHTAFDGWSKKALFAAAGSIGVDNATATRLFPQYGASLIEWLDGWLDRQMVARVGDVELNELPVRQRISKLVWARFQTLGPHQEAMRRATLTRGLPQNFLKSSKGIWQTADNIWELAGFPNVPSDGFSRYSRRALLVGILASTFLFWLEDMSDDFQETQAFMERRISNALSIGKLSGKIKRLLPFGPVRLNTA